MYDKKQKTFSKRKINLLFNIKRVLRRAIYPPFEKSALLLIQPCLSFKGRRKNREYSRGVNGHRLMSWRLQRRRPTSNLNNEVARTLNTRPRGCLHSPPSISALSKDNFRSKLFTFYKTNASASVRASFNK